MPLESLGYRLYFHPAVNKQPHMKTPIRTRLCCGAHSDMGYSAALILGIPINAGEYDGTQHTRATHKRHVRTIFGDQTAGHVHMRARVRARHDFLQTHSLS